MKFVSATNKLGARPALVDAERVVDGFLQALDVTRRAAAACAPRPSAQETGGPFHEAKPTALLPGGRERFHERLCRRDVLWHSRRQFLGELALV